MAKRKFGLSIIVLIVAATTMVSGTYAWFLVGGFAELFDLGFEVIEAGGGIEIQGSAGKAYLNEADETGADWGSYLKRDCFAEGELIAEGGKYAPVSSADGAAFTKVGLEGGYFKSLTPTKGTDYNEMTIKIRSTTEAEVNAKINIALTGNDAGNEAVSAARVSVKYGDSAPVIFAIAGDATQAVTSNEIPEGTVMDTNNNSIIDSSEANGVSLSGQSVTELVANAADANKYEGSMDLPGVPGNTGYETIVIRVWIEGNDTDCTGEKLSAKYLSTQISFGSSSEEETPAA